MVIGIDYSEESINYAMKNNKKMVVYHLWLKFTSIMQSLIYKVVLAVRVV